MSKPILFTGIRPTGELHIGHYFSLIEPIKQRMNEYQIYVMIADLHALTELRSWSGTDYGDLKKMINLNTSMCIETLNQFVPVKDMVIFRQSDMKTYHYDLFYKMLMISKHSQTFGNPIFQDAMQSEFNRSLELLKLDSTVKDLIKFFSKDTDIIWNNISSHLSSVLHGFLMMRDCSVSPELLNKIVKYLNNRSGIIGFATYPILMAADILLYDPAVVLVGKDQSPHIQIANDLVKLLNTSFNLNINPVVPMITEEKTIKGFDGFKMSKSMGNHLLLRHLLSPIISSSLEWFMKLKTYPKKKLEAGNPDECLVAESIKYFIDNNPNDDKCMRGEIGCVDCKNYAHESVKALFQFNKKDEKIDVQYILADGFDKAKNRMLHNKNINNLLDI